MPQNISAKYCCLCWVKEYCKSFKKDTQQKSGDKLKSKFQILQI